MENRKDRIVYFCSGYRDITENEFDQHYKPQLLYTLNYDCDYVMGDCKGADLMCLEFLLNIGIEPNRITIYHMFSHPRTNKLVKKNSLVAELLIDRKIKLKGGFTSDSERDADASNNSTHDILWTRDPNDIPNYDPNKISGTQMNYLRRLKLKTLAM